MSRGGSSSGPLGGRGWRVTFLLGSRASWSSTVSYRPPALLFSGIIAHLCFGLLACEVRVTPASWGFGQVLYEDPAWPVPRPCSFSLPGLSWYKTEWAPREQASPNDRVLRGWIPGTCEVTGPGADLEEQACSWHGHPQATQTPPRPNTLGLEPPARASHVASLLLIPMSPPIPVFTFTTDWLWWPPPTPTTACPAPAPRPLLAFLPGPPSQVPQSACCSVAAGCKGPHHPWCGSRVPASLC